VKIIEYRHNYSACDLKDIKDFDYTQLEDYEMFEMIKQTLIQNECLGGNIEILKLIMIGRERMF